MPSAKVRVLIRRPVAEVFEAIVDPAVLTSFWLSSASGRLEAGRSVHWKFLVKGAEVDSYVRELVRNERIVIDWSDGSKLVWKLESRADGSTLLEVENSGFAGDESTVIETALEATQGFTLVLCDLKVLLETKSHANLARDKAVLIEEAMAKQR